MNEREEIGYRVMRALDHSRTASEEQEAADQTHSTPEAAEALHWDAAGLLEGSIVRLQALYDRHVFDAKRMGRAQREETRTGVEYRSGDAA